MDIEEEKNVLGGVLEPCSLEPMTGFHRTGRCQTGPHDHGCHAVCIQVTEAFLEFSKAAGNDLSTPMEAYGFPGLKAGDRWCLCAARWQEARVIPLLENYRSSPQVLELANRLLAAALAVSCRGSTEDGAG